MYGIDKISAMLLTETEMVTLYKKPGVILDPIASILGSICDFLFNIVSSAFSSATLGITIILFTIAVRILLLPLAAYSAKSMAKMRVIQPEIKKIQAKYKGKTDLEAKQRMSAEISELQRKSGANPFNGCLPMVIQLPIIYALFFILQRVYLYISTIGNLYDEITAVLLKIDNIGPKMKTIVETMPQLKRYVENDGWFDLAYADNCNEVISKMSTADWDMLLASFPEDAISQLTPLLDTKTNIEYFLGMNLVERPSFMSVSIIICILSALTTFLSTWLMSKGQDPNADEQVKMQQRMMLFTMPFVTGFISLSVPAGIGIYWIMGNVVQIAQQFVFNRIFDPSKETAK